MNSSVSGSRLLNSEWAGGVVATSDSTGLGWSYVQAEALSQRGVVERLETAPSEGLTLVLHRRGTAKHESKAGRRWRHAQYGPGSVGLTAPGKVDVVRWRRAGDVALECLVVRLDPRLLTIAARAVTQPRALESLNQIHVNDRFVSASLFAIGRAMRTRGDAVGVETVALALSSHLLSGRAFGPDPCSSGLGPAELRQVLDFLGDNLDNSISLESLASLVHMSPFHFVRQFKISVGTTPHQHLIELRMCLAQRLLAHTDMSIAEVAARSGYVQPSHFTSQFRRRRGMTPTNYRHRC